MNSIVQMVIICIGINHAKPHAQLHSQLPLLQMKVSANTHAQQLSIYTGMVHAKQVVTIH